MDCKLDPETHALQKTLPIDRFGRVQLSNHHRILPETPFELILTMTWVIGRQWKGKIEEDKTKIVSITTSGLLRGEIGFFFSPETELEGCHFAGQKR